VWAYDFVEGRTHDGRKFRSLTIIDDGHYGRPEIMAWCEVKRPGFSGGSFHWAMQPYRGSRGLHSSCLRPQRAGCAR
jgi:hypothetical protein